MQREKHCPGSLTIGCRTDLPMNNIKVEHFNKNLLIYAEENIKIIT